MKFKIIVLLILIICGFYVKNSKKILSIYFAVWIILTFLFTLFRKKNNIPQAVILIPFNSYHDMLQYTWDYSSKYIAEGLIGNVLLFVPLGELMVSQKEIKLKYVVLIAFFISLFIECTQLCFQIGCFEVDDLIHNTYGTFIGYQAVLFKEDHKFVRIISFVGFLAILISISVFSYL